MKEAEVKLIAGWINEVVEIVKGYPKMGFVEFDERIKVDSRILEIRNSVVKLCVKFPFEV